MRRTRPLDELTTCDFREYPCLQLATTHLYMTSDHLRHWNTRDRVVSFCSFHRSTYRSNFNNITVKVIEVSLSDIFIMEVMGT